MLIDHLVAMRDPLCFYLFAGLRIGKGEGFADLEWAMMSSMGAVNDSTVVVATCHDCQVLDLPEKLFGPHDLNVDFILTPTQVSIDHH